MLMEIRDSHWAAERKERLPSVLQEMVSNYILLLKEKKNVELNKPISMHQQHNIIMRTNYKIARNFIACFSLKV